MGAVDQQQSLTLAHVLAGVGAEHDPPIQLEQIHVIRHSFRANDESALRGFEDLTVQKVHAYTREQDVSPRRFPAQPGQVWAIFIADGKNRSRLWGAFENHGELEEERTQDCRYFDLRPSNFLATLKDRLVVDWDNPRSWHRSAQSASARRMQVIEIADRDKVPFPGFDGVLLTFHQLRELVDDSRYSDWRAALAEVQASTSSPTPAMANNTSARQTVLSESSGDGRPMPGMVTAATWPQGASRRERRQYHGCQDRPCPPLSLQPSPCFRAEHAFHRGQRGGIALQGRLDDSDTRPQPELTPPQPPRREAILSALTAPCDPCHIQYREPVRQPDSRTAWCEHKPLDAHSYLPYFSGRSGVRRTQEGNRGRTV